MNDLKIEMLGSAIQEMQDEDYDMPLGALIDEPQEAGRIRYLKGVVALVMEQMDPPSTVLELRHALREFGMSDELRSLAPYTIVDLLADGILNVSTDDKRKMSYRPPVTSNYVRALLMDD